MKQQPSIASGVCKDVSFSHLKGKAIKSTLSLAAMFCETPFETILQAQAPHKGEVLKKQRASNEEIQDACTVFVLDITILLVKLS